MVKRKMISSSVLLTSQKLYAIPSLGFLQFIWVCEILCDPVENSHLC